MRFLAHLIIFSWQLKRKHLLEYIFIGDYVTHFTFSLSFPDFCLKKIQISMSFPEVLTIFQIP